MIRRLLGVSGALTLVVLSGAQYFGWAYARHAQDTLNRPSSERTAVAAERGAGLTPWSADRLAVRGWLLSQRGERDAALGSYAQALRWAPADAAIWTEYALVLARARRFEQLSLPVTRANALGRASPPIQETQAAMGTTYWNAADEVTRAEWLRSLQYQLRHNNSAFNELLVVRGQVGAFCEGPAPRLGTFRKCATTSAP